MCTNKNLRILVSFEQGVFDAQIELKECETIKFTGCQEIVGTFLLQKFT
jgi:hypothetical protein